MATGTVKWFGNCPQAFMNKEIDLLSDAIMVALSTSAYTPDQDAHDYFNDVTNELTTANGYTAGGQQIANDTLTYTSGTNVMKYDGDDMSWTSSSITARVATIYDSTPGTAATDPLIGYCVFNADVTTSAGTLAIAWDSAGILTLTAA